MLALALTLPLLAAAAPPPPPSPNPITLPVSAHGFFSLWGSETDYLANKYGHGHQGIARRGMEERQAGSADLSNIGVTYTVPLEIGNPPQKFDSVIDTGSSVTWVIANCTDPSECGQAPVFNGSQSSTLLESDTPYDIQYGRGSAAGHVAYDEIAVGGQKAQAAFVMVDELTEWGLSFSSLTGFSPRTGAWFLRVAGTWAEPIFGLYLGRSEQAAPANPVPGNGLLTLGGVDSSKFTGDLHWIDANITGWWTIPLEGLKVSGQDIDLTLETAPYSHTGGRPAAVIDSGTTLVNGPRAAITEMYAKLNATEISNGLFVFPCANGVPPISLTFGGVAYTMHPADTIMGSSPVSYIRDRFNVSLPGADDDYYCRAAIDIFEPPSADFAAPKWIIGAAFMRSVYTAHRLTPPALGFAPVAEAAATPDGVVNTDSGARQVASAASRTAAGAGLAAVALVVALAAL
ncbi:acid protease [Cutaneotrichosporon oleaginosum]|uniref:Acid protease n=1 Tax=Cutaneotrichosporon oleaginosum TaxID=879819 RepID=A0A0J0XIZ2_9TREE|nr:acid protease [Cutaneotrichosporon oleaginosum]KLT41065.1 acid protease [Cutaneotrichosporon oleaginosum]TXT12155.1 hypothetical protein COLE_02565 [Cutaneotrichosporon oleaginosum]